VFSVLRGLSPCGRSLAPAISALTSCPPDELPPPPLAHPERPKRVATSAAIIFLDEWAAIVRLLLSD
jgi:hypothetical protein